MTASIPGYCTLCRSRCGTLNTVQNDTLVSVQPDPDHPTGQAMCMKGRAAPEIVHSVNRQLHPLRRTTPKGAPDPGWRRISWEEALAETADRLGTFRRESGAESVAFAVTTPSGTPLSDSIDWIERFVRHFGSPNICYGTEICNWHKDFAHAFTFGCGIPPADYANAETILLWGHNPTSTWLAQANAIARGRANGARMVVVDPRPTALARQADVWMRVRPGTDAALALGIMRRLIETRRYDDEFVRGWTNGPLLVRSDTGLFLRARDVFAGSLSDSYVAWDKAAGCAVPFDPQRPPSDATTQQLKLRGSVAVRVDGSAAAVECLPAFEMLARAAEPYNEDTVQSITGVEPEKLRAAAGLLSGGRRIAYHAWTGLGQHTNATQSERAVATLYALSGSFDRIGGNRVGRGPFPRAVNAVGHLSPEQRSKALGIDQRPIGPPAMGWVTARDMYRAILDGDPYRVRGLVCFGTNLPVSQADTATAQAALGALEFHVHCDLFETPAARYADIFLPVNSPWEHEGLRIGFEIDDEAASLVQLRQRMVSPRGESRSDNDIVFDLATRLGMADAFFGGSLEAGWNHMLSPLGLDVASLRQRPQGIRVPVDTRERKFAAARADKPASVVGFATETGRAELYSELLHRHGQPAVATYVPPAGTLSTGGAISGDYPLTLSSAKNGYYCHSQHRSLASLRRRAPDPIAEISTGLAGMRGVNDGDWIRISTREGHARFVARVTPQLADDIVVAEFGWWQASVDFDRPEMPVSGDMSSNFNSLIGSQQIDPVSGSTPLRSSRCNIELDPATEQRQRRWQGYRTFRVAELSMQADDVLAIRFEPLDGAPLPDYRPGQHVEIKIWTGSEPVARAYSLTGPASVPRRQSYSIAVRHHKGVLAGGEAFAGAASHHIHTRLAVGQLVELKAPTGGFVLPRRSAQPLVLFAGGIGITPFVSLLASLPDGDPAEIRLYYGNSNRRFHTFREEIERHQARLPGLSVVDFYSRPDGASERTGRIGAHLVDDDLLSRRPRFYMCGPSAMMDEVQGALLARGVPRFDIFREIFHSPSCAPADDGRTFDVAFRRSRNTPAAWSSQQGTLLSFGESLGIEMPSGCRVGQCESCAVRIVSGSVAHLDGRDADDPSVCLTCCAVPITDLILDI
ncbi:MAG: molybdopterin-dependent oxidoreductase [Rhizobiaceae bacterium]